MQNLRTIKNILINIIKLNGDLMKKLLLSALSLISLQVTIQASKESAAAASASGASAVVANAQKDTKSATAAQESAAVVGALQVGQQKSKESLYKRIADRVKRWEEIYAQRKVACERATGLDAEVQSRVCAREDNAKSTFDILKSILGLLDYIRVA